MLMKYTKRLSALVCAVLLTLCTSVAAFAEASYKLNDSADIFTSEQDTTIEEQLYEVSDLTGWDVIIYTNERGIDSYDMEEVCNDFYDISGFGRIISRISYTNENLYQKIKSNISPSGRNLRFRRRH